VHQQNRVGIPGALVQVVHSQFTPFTVIHLQVIGAEVVTRQVDETVVVGSQEFHGTLLAGIVFL
jgi:hypothetical protein